MTELWPRLRIEPSGAGRVCRQVLAELPEWFGIEEAVEDCVAAADRSPTVVASLDGEDVGFLTLARHSPQAAEVQVMGVLPALPRRGIGRALLLEAQAWLQQSGVEYLQVKTLSSGRPDAGYEKTRAFYLANGFRVLEELPTLWGPRTPRSCS